MAASASLPASSISLPRGPTLPSCLPDDISSASSSSVRGPNLQAKKIGRGAYGTVYPSLANPEGEVCKVFDDPWSLLTELGFYKALQDCPYLPRLGDFELELTEGENKDNAGWLCLEKFQIDLRRYRPELKASAKKIAYLLLTALADIHRRGVCHLDIKPANILLQLDGAGRPDRLTICDWGTARVQGGIHIPKGTPFQTRGYRAPEMLLEAGGYSSKMDIWAAGAIIYQLFVGMPISNVRQGEVVEVVGILAKTGVKEGNLATFFPELVGPGRALSATDTYLNQILHGLLDPNPDSRWSASKALAHPFWEGFSRLYPAPPDHSSFRDLDLARVGRMFHLIPPSDRAWLEEKRARFGLSLRTIDVAAHVASLAMSSVATLGEGRSYRKPDLPSQPRPFLGPAEEPFLLAVCLELASNVHDSHYLTFKRNPLMVGLTYKICRLIDFNLPQLESVPWLDSAGHALPTHLPGQITTGKPAPVHPSPGPIPKIYRIPWAPFYLIVDVGEEKGRELYSLGRTISRTRARRYGVELGPEWRHRWTTPSHKRYLLFLKVPERAGEETPLRGEGTPIRGEEGKMGEVPVEDDP